MDTTRTMEESLLLQYFEPRELADLTPSAIRLLAAVRWEPMPALPGEGDERLHRCSQAERPSGISRHPLDEVTDEPDGVSHAQQPVRSYGRARDETAAPVGLQADR